MLTGLQEIKEPPSWIPEDFSPEVVPAKRIRRLSKLSPITVVRVHGLRSVLDNEAFLTQLAMRLRATPRPAKVVFVLGARSSAGDPQSLKRVLAFFDRASDVEFVRGVNEVEFALSEALAKIWADPTADQEEIIGSDPLGGLKSVIGATKDLRSSSGRLSAERIADAFGLTSSALAVAIGSTRQALHKTPDSETIQRKLFPFERIARLRAVLPPEDFRAWLNMSNGLLDGHSPIQIIKRGEAAVVANLAEDMLTGSPT